MATEINTKWVDKLATEVKRAPGNSERYYSEKCGVPMNQILRHLVLAELKANPSLKIAATGPAVVKARNAGLRWPRIAAYAGITEGRAKQLYEEQTGGSARDSYTGRGRNWSGTAPTGGTGGKRGAKKTGVQHVARGTSGRRGAAAGKAQPQKRGAAAKRGTRAAARAAANPK